MGGLPKTNCNGHAPLHLRAPTGRILLHIVVATMDKQAEEGGVASETGAPQVEYATLRRARALELAALQKRGALRKAKVDWPEDAAKPITWEDFMTDFDVRHARERD